ncbi:MAG: methyltransferase domain-containing protein [Planctomycetota bacterium]
MHPAVFQAFDRICRARSAGGAVLEVGAVPSDDSLLCLPALRGAASRVGINLDGPHRHDGFEIVRGDANDMQCFGDSSFDTVLCNATLEHDPRFWLTLAAIRRVARPGAVVAIGVPGFDRLPSDTRLRRLGMLPGLPRWIRVPPAALACATLTLQVHDFPGDYYRFSPQAVREVFCAGLRDVSVETVLVPPRAIGSGIRA